MKHSFVLLLISVLGVVYPLQAQYETVKYDATNNWFNQGQKLPAETDLVFTGQVPADIHRIELSFLDSKNDEVIYTGNWRRANAETEFSLPVNYKLRSDFTYNIRLTSFGKASTAEINQLSQQIKVNLITLLEVNQKQSESIEFKVSRRKLVEDMNSLLQDQLADYRIKADNWSPVLSELVALKLQQMDQLDLAHSYQRQDTTLTKKELKDAKRSEQLAAFQQLLSDEIDNILDVELYRLRDSRMVKDYRTEKKPTVLSLNLGYAGVYLSGKWTNGQYASAPYAGIAIPLGNRILGTKFFRNAAINTGVFLNKLAYGDGKEAKGFLIDQPIYLGLDYKLFQFIHFNVGTALLNGNTFEDNGIQVGNQQLAFRPFVGLSARINLRLGLSN